MHNYLIELYLNDENGNPGNRETFQYFDAIITAQAYYEEKHAIMQTDEEGKSTGNRKYTIKVSEAKYIINSDPSTIWARVRG